MSHLNHPLNATVAFPNKPDDIGLNEVFVGVDLRVYPFCYEMGNFAKKRVFVPVRGAQYATKRARFLYVVLFSYHAPLVLPLFNK